MQLLLRLLLHKRRCNHRLLLCLSAGRQVTQFGFLNNWRHTLASGRWFVATAKAQRNGAIDKYGLPVEMLPRVHQYYWNTDDTDGTDFQDFIKCLPEYMPPDYTVMQ